MQHFLQDHLSKCFDISFRKSFSWLRKCLKFSFWSVYSTASPMYNHTYMYMRTYLHPVGWYRWQQVCNLPNSSSHSEQHKVSQWRTEKKKKKKIVFVRFTKNGGRLIVHSLVQLTHRLVQEDPSIQQSTSPGQDWLQVRPCNQEKLRNSVKTRQRINGMRIDALLTHCKAHLPSLSDGRRLWTRQPCLHSSTWNSK